MENDADDLGQAVVGFRRAEVALAAIAADADRLVDARVEVEEARDELKVVAGALVGLATAHRDLVGQLGEAATALRPSERRNEDLLIDALREAEAARARQVAEVADAVEELARRLDRALAERIGGFVAEMGDRMPTAEQVAAVANRLDELARADHLVAVAERLDGLASSADLSALADRLDRLEGLATAAQIEELTGVLADRFDGLGGLATTAQIEGLATTAQIEELTGALADRFDLLGAVATTTQIEELTGALADRFDLLGAVATTAQIEELTRALAGLASADQLAALGDRLDQLEVRRRADLELLQERLAGLDQPAPEPLSLGAGPPDPDAAEVLVGRLDRIDRDAEQLGTAIQELLAALPTPADLAPGEQAATSSDLEAMEGRLSRGLAGTSTTTATAGPAPAPLPPAEEVAELAATQVAAAVEDQVAWLAEQVQASQWRVQQLGLAVGVASLLFAALLSILALR